MNIEVTGKIKVEITGQTLRLTLDEAKDLRRALDNVLGEDIPYKHYPPEESR